MFFSYRSPNFTQHTVAGDGKARTWPEQFIWQDVHKYQTHSQLMVNDILVIVKLTVVLTSVLTIVLTYIWPLFFVKTSSTN